MSSLPRRLRIAGSLVSAIVLYVAGGVMVVAGFARGNDDPTYWLFAVVLITVASATLLLPAMVERQREVSAGPLILAGEGPAPSPDAPSDGTAAGENHRPR